jgi:hypothetical protein
MGLNDGVIILYRLPMDLSLKMPELVKPRIMTATSLKTQSAE